MDTIEHSNRRWLDLTNFIRLSIKIDADSYYLLNATMNETKHIHRCQMFSKYEYWLIWYKIQSIQRLKKYYPYTLVASAVTHPHYWKDVLHRHNNMIENSQNELGNFHNVTSPCTKRKLIEKQLPK